MDITSESYSKVFVSEILRYDPSALIVLDKELNVLFVSERFCRDYQVAEQATVGRHIYDVFPDTSQEWRQLHQRALAGEVLGGEGRLHENDDGQVDWTQWECRPWHTQDGEIGGIVLYGEVQSGRKHVELALQQSELIFHTLFTAMTEIVVLHELVFDEQGQAVNYRITDCNSAFSRITGIERQAAVGRLATEVYGVEEPPFLDVYARVAMTGKSDQYETYYAPMGKYFMVSAVSHGLNQFATITTDATGMRQAQQAVQAKNKELEQIIYVASHDLRSPLVNIDGYARELQYAVEDLVSIAGRPLPEIEDALGHIRNSSKQMDRLLKGLLRLSRTGRGLLTIDFIEMNRLIKSVLDSMEFKLREAGVEVQVSELPPCMGDPVQVNQVFTNLIGNAVKYLDPERPGKISIRGETSQGRCRYCVEDNGIGIAPQHQQNIFEIFHRLDPGKTEGEGLGLTIVQQVLGRMDGQIGVESIPGEGSRFFVNLPHPNHTQRQW